MASVVSEGVWDEALEAYSSYTSDVTNMTMNSSITDPNGTAVSASSYASMHMEMTGAPGANGGVDSVMDGSAEGYTATMTGPMGPGMPPLNLSLTADGQTYHYETKGVRAAPIFDLVAFGVANAAAGPSAEKQEELRAMLQSAMPFFESIGGTAEITNLKVQTMLGEFGADTIGVELDLNGGVADGRFREAISIAGLSIPPGLAPPWAEPLVPTEARFDVQVSNFNLADPLNAIIASFDAMKPEPFAPGFEMQLLGAFMPTGAVDVTFLPTSVSNDMYSVNLEGAMAAGLGGPPTGQGTVTAIGVDAVQAALQAAPPEIAGQVLMPMGMATGMAKPGPNGELVWEIDATTPGKLLINGVDLMGMQ
jgi:hypothetical protein